MKTMQFHSSFRQVNYRGNKLLVDHRSPELVQGQKYCLSER